jgi:lysozyme
MKTSNKCKSHIKSFESLQLKPYYCPSRVASIGYGTTRYPNGHAVKISDPAITHEQAEAFFNADIERFEHDVMSLVTVPMTQGEFDALVSFAYNAGSDIDDDKIAEGLGDSTLLRLFNAGDKKGAAAEFLKWNKGHVNGKRVELAGLTRRRNAERSMFLGVA